MSELQSAMRCEACGGELQYSEDRKKARCLHCGNEYFFKEQKSNSLVLALNLANQKRAACDFDGAAIEYKAVLEENPNDAEANWGLAISIYGIEYVEDPRTKKRIPTCRRTIKESILDNEYYKAALANATSEQRELYREKAEVIDRLQKKIKRQLEDEEEYDVFISFKSTDDNGRPTRDRQIARTIYDELKKRGIKTFYSEVTLKNRIGEDYEPIIYKALYSCKFFILVATSEENLNAAWVKNEWSRFRDRVQDESLINAGCAVFDNLNVNELPPFLRGQGISLAKYPAGGYEVEIADGLAARFGLTNKNEEAEEIKRQIEEQKKFQKELEKRLKQVQSSKPAAGGTTTDALMTRAMQELSVGDMTSARNYFQKTVDADPSNGKAFWGLFLCALKAKNVEEAAKKVDRETLSQALQNKNFKIACKFADEDTKREIVLYAKMVSAQLAERIAELEPAYKQNLAEGQRIDAIIKQKKSEREEIIRKAKSCGKYNKELFEQGRKTNLEELYQEEKRFFAQYHQQPNWDNYFPMNKCNYKAPEPDGAKGWAAVFIAAIAVAIVFAVLFFILGIIAYNNGKWGDATFMPGLYAWIESWFWGNITVPIVIGLIAGGVVCLVGAIIVRKKGANEMKLWERGLNNYEQEVDLSNQVIDLNRQILKLLTKKDLIDQIIKEQKANYEFDCSVLRALSPSNGNKG